MANLLPRRIADGRLSDTKGTLYSVPASTKTMLKSIILHNTSDAPVTVTLYFKATTSRIVMYQELDARETVYFNESTVLENPQVIEGEADVDNVVDYWMSGAEYSE